MCFSSPLAGSEERRGGRRVVGHIHDGCDLRYVLSKKRLDSLSERHLGEAAPLTPTLQANPNTALDSIDHRHVSTVCADRAIDLLVDRVTDTRGEIAGFLCVCRRFAGPA